MADLTDLLDPVRLENIIRMLEQMAQTINNVDREADSAGETFSRNLETIHKMEDGFVDYGKVVKSTLTDLGREYQYMIKVEFLASTNDALEKAEARWKAYGQEVRRQLSQARGGVLGTAGGTMGVSGQRGALRGAQAMFQQVMGSLPFGIGGMLGLMLYGKKREQEFEAAAFRISRVLDQVGGVGRTQIRSIEQRVRAMNFAWGSAGEELETVLSSYAQFGMGIEVMDKAGVSARGFGSDVLGITAALEAAYRLQPGSLAQQIGTVFQAGGTEREALLKDFMTLAHTADLTRQNVGGLVGIMTQSASSMRVQRQGVADLADEYAKLYNVLQAGTMAGAPRQAVGAAALRGIQAAAGGIAGLPEGLMAEMGRRAGTGSGIEAIIAFQEGRLGGQGAQGRQFELIVQQLGELAREVAGPGRAEQIFALQKIAPSLGFEGARAVVDAMSGGATLADVVEGVKTPQERLLNAFQRRGAEESDWEKVQRQVMLHLAKVGGSLLTITMAGFDTLIRATAAVASGDPAAAQRAAVRFADVQETEGRNLLKAMKGIGRSVGGGIDLVPGFLRDVEADDERRRAATMSRVQAQQEEMRAVTAAQREFMGAIQGAETLPASTQARMGGIGRRAAARAFERYGTGNLGRGKARVAALQALEEEGFVTIEGNAFSAEIKITSKARMMNPKAEAR